MTAIWRLTSESVRVEPDVRHSSAAEGAPPETQRVFISTPLSCRVIVTADGDELAFVGQTTIQFRRNPEPGEKLTVGPAPGMELVFVAGQPPANGIVVGSTTAQTIDNIAALLRTMDYGADRSLNDFLQIRAPGFGPATDNYVVKTGEYAVAPPPGEVVHFRGGTGTYLPGNCGPQAFLAQQGDRVFVLGSPSAASVGGDPAAGGGLTATWSAT